MIYSPSLGSKSLTSAVSVPGTVWAQYRMGSGGCNRVVWPVTPPLLPQPLEVVWGE